MQRKTSNFLEHYLPGQSDSVKTLRGTIELLNTTRNKHLVRTVLVTGESGSGKNHVARIMAAHRDYMDESSTRDDPDMQQNLQAWLGRFDEIHLPALADSLVESELFGHKKGAFTSAADDKLGLLSQEGDVVRTDILLDEIGDASPPLQAKLLQVVETGRFRAVGAEPGDDEVTNARLIFATNRNLTELVGSGEFREDLYWRISNFCIEVPPLRASPELLPDLTRSILHSMQADLPEELEREADLMLTSADLRWCRNYDWPGNVRQLRAALLVWLVEGGKLPMKEIFSRYKLQKQAFTSRPKGRTSVITQLKNGQSVGSLDALLQSEMRRLQSEIVDWFYGVKPTNEQLAALFDKSRPLSVRHKISDWRRLLGESK